MNGQINIPAPKEILPFFTAFVRTGKVAARHQKKTDLAKGNFKSFRNEDIAIKTLKTER